MITDEQTVEGQSHQFNFTTKDTEANIVMMEVFNAITELAQAGVEDVQVSIQKKPTTI